MSAGEFRLIRESLNDTCVGGKLWVCPSVWVRCVWGGVSVVCRAANSPENFRSPGNGE